MFEIIETETYKKDFNKIKDFQTRKAIEQRIERVANNNWGDFKSLKNELYELRFLTLGIRIYFTKHEDKIILLLKAGNKQTQNKDIEKCKKILQNI